MEDFSGEGKKKSGSCRFFDLRDAAAKRHWVLVRMDTGV